jgi:hypothetical protein
VMIFRGKITSILMIAAVAFLWLGCGSKEIAILQEQSVGRIPCRTDEIEITEYKINKADGSGYWIAFCNGKTYRCVRGKTDQTDTNNQDVVCERVDSPEI